MNAEEALSKLPAQIRKTENDVFARKQALDGLRLRLKLREADVALAVAAAPDPADPKKRLHTNADARDAAARAALATDAEALAAKRALQEEEALIARMSSTLDYYRDVQRNARVLLLARSPATVLFDDPEMAS